LVYNGDIISLSGFNNRAQIFHETNCWMLGRGVLMNPFLPAEIKGKNFSKHEKFLKLVTFHKRVFELYSEKMDNDGNVLNKMKQFWIYFSYNFSDQKSCFKQIKKANSLSKYQNAIKVIFGNASNS
jgi:tRNA-dihydrouridine synthase